MNFSEVYKIDVSSYVEKKNGLSYLSWANAWKEFKLRFPDAKYEVRKNEQGLCAFGDDEHGYMVYTSVTADGHTYEMWLPIMDYKNKSILKPTTFDINKAVMRCLTKNLAMFGLGLYIYAGEDLPEDNPSVDDLKAKGYNIQEVKPITITLEQSNEILAALPAGLTAEWLCEKYKIKSLLEIKQSQLPGLLKRLGEMNAANE